MSAAAATSRALSIRPIDQPMEARTNPTETNPTQASAVSELSLRERLEQLAYELWEQRGRPEGSAETDWNEAERQIMGQRSPTAAAAVA